MDAAAPTRCAPTVDAADERQEAPPQHYLSERDGEFRVVALPLLLKLCDAGSTASRRTLAKTSLGELRSSPFYNFEQACNAA
jgi:hypothetical protein